MFVSGSGFNRSRVASNAAIITTSKSTKVLVLYGPKPFFILQPNTPRATTPKARIPQKAQCGFITDDQRAESFQMHEQSKTASTADLRSPGTKEVRPSVNAGQEMGYSPLKPSCLGGTCLQRCACPLSRKVTLAESPQELHLGLVPGEQPYTKRTCRARGRPCVGNGFVSRRGWGEQGTRWNPSFSNSRKQDQRPQATQRKTGLERRGDDSHQSQLQVSFIIPDAHGSSVYIVGILGIAVFLDNSDDRHFGV